MLTPRPFQRAEIPRLLSGHHLLAWEAGVGKTLPLILAGAMTGLPQLWITRADLVPQAAAVIAQERDDSPLVQVIRNGRDRVDPRADVVVVSYDLMRTVPIWKQLFALRWGSITCDEAHALKDTTSVRSQAIYGKRQDSPGALFRRTKNVWLATGTPILRNPMDLWPHVSRLWPHEMPAPPTKTGWENHHCLTRPGQHGPIVIGARRPDEIRAMLGRIGSQKSLEIAARLDVDEIPVEISTVDRQRIEASVEPAEWRLIEALFADMDGGAAREQMQEEARLLSITVARRVLGLAKAMPTARIAEGELQGGLQQIIVWGWHRQALSDVATALHRFGTALMNGDMPQHQREITKAQFMAGKLRVLVANLEVAGTGLDGLQCSHRCLIMEPDWLPGKNTQAIRRQYREGQRHPVHASFVTVARSPDEIIGRVLARRARMIETSTGVAA